jgi:hypothetical protein
MVLRVMGLGVWVEFNWLRVEISGVSSGYGYEPSGSTKDGELLD